MDLIRQKACRYNLRPRKSVLCYYYGRRRMKKPKWDNLPEDIQQLILLKLSAELIYDVMRCVCSDWRHTILNDSSFINSHLKNSNHGLILRNQDDGGSLEFVEATNPDGNGVVVSHHTLDYSGCDFISSSCNGLIVVWNYTNHELVYCILNPITKQKLIPPILGLSEHCHLGYAASSREYKMVRHSTIDSTNTISAVEVVTLGPDQGWRILCTWPNFITDIYAAGGSIQWIEMDESRLVSLNLETETFQELPYPHVNTKRFLVMGDKLSFVSTDENRLFFGLWVLVEQHNVAKWIKMCDISLQRWECTFERICDSLYIIPVGWLRAMELIVFSIGFYRHIYIAYNIKTQQIHPFRVKGSMDHGAVRSFVKSLVSPNAIWIKS